MFNKNYKIIKAESLDVGVLEVEYKGQYKGMEIDKEYSIQDLELDKEWEE